MDEQITQSWLQYQWQNNTVGEYLIAVGLFAVLVVVFKLIETFVLHRLEKIALRTKTEVDDVVVKIVSTLRPPFYLFVAFYVAVSYLAIEGFGKEVLRVILVAWITYQVVIVLHILVDFAIHRKLTRTNTGNAQAIANIIHGIVTIALWSLGILFVLSNLGVNVTALVAGLGVGGLAFALAAQNLLGDLISSLAIFFDKPFVPGEFITVGSESGTVLRIGIKTTRLKSVNGEEIIIPNRDIAAARVKNFKRMTERRIGLSVGIGADVMTEKLVDLPLRLSTAITSVGEARFGRATLHSLEGGVYEYRVVYYVLKPDFATYMKTQEQVILALKQTLEKEKAKLEYIKVE